MSEGLTGETLAVVDRGGSLMRGRASRAVAGQRAHELGAPAPSPVAARPQSVSRSRAPPGGTPRMAR